MNRDLSLSFQLRSRFPTFLKYCNSLIFTMFSRISQQQIIIHIYISCTTTSRNPDCGSTCRPSVCSRKLLPLNRADQSCGMLVGCGLLLQGFHKSMVKQINAKGKRWKEDKFQRVVLLIKKSPRSFLHIVPTVAIQTHNVHQCAGPSMTY